MSILALRFPETVQRKWAMDWLLETQGEFPALPLTCGVNLGKPPCCPILNSCNFIETNDLKIAVDLWFWHIWVINYTSQVGNKEREEKRKTRNKERKGMDCKEKENPSSDRRFVRSWLVAQNIRDSKRAFSGASGWHRLPLEQVRVSDLLTAGQEPYLHTPRQLWFEIFLCHFSVLWLYFLCAIDQ